MEAESNFLMELVLLREVQLPDVTIIQILYGMLMLKRKYELFWTSKKISFKKSSFSMLELIYRLKGMRSHTTNRIIQDRFALL